MRAASFLKNGISDLYRLSRELLTGESGSGDVALPEERSCMKQPSKPTRMQKELIAENRLNPENWMVVFESKDTLEIISKRTAMRKILEKPVVRRGRK